MAAKLTEDRLVASGSKLRRREKGKKIAIVAGGGVWQGGSHGGASVFVAAVALSSLR